MKTVISYVSGTGGDFVVNCCNHTWNSLADKGNVIPSASIKKQEQTLGDPELLAHINELPYNYIGSHGIDRLLHMPVRVIWLTVPQREQLWTWTVRDCVTRQASRLMGRYGTVYEQIQHLVQSEKSQQAAEMYLDWLNNYNWTLMQMRLVQPTNKIDIAQLLQPSGIDSLIDQLPELQPTADQCRQYHTTWLAQQQPLTNTDWVLNCVAAKLQQLVNGH
jgi:hypothetical protein